MGKNGPTLDVLPLYWHSNNEPDTLINRCMVLQNKGDRSLWNWDSCDAPQSFVCQFGI